MPGWFDISGGHTSSPGTFTLIRQHGDGRLIASIIDRFGIHSVAGSSSRGAVEGAKKLVEKLVEGFDIAITPDGPRGPAQKLKRGVIKIAQISGATIFPVSVAARRAKCFKSWDRMMLPLPFSKIVAACGPGITVPADADAADIENLANDLEKSLNHVTNLVDGWAAE